MPELLAGLKGLRKARGLSQKQLAEAAGVSVQTVAKHEQGLQGGVDGPTIEAFCRVLVCERAELFLPYNSEIAEKPQEAASA